MNFGSKGSLNPASFQRTLSFISQSFRLFSFAGPVQFVGPTANEINHTLMLELGAQA